MRNAVLVLFLAACAVTPSVSAVRPWASDAEFNAHLLAQVDNGDARSMEVYAGLLMNGTHGVSLDPERGVTLLFRAAKTGHAHFTTLNLLGEISLKKEPKRALAFFKESAEQGSSKAMLQLGRMCLRGTGTPKDIEASIEWLEKAADRKNAESTLLLASVYALGLDVPRDFKRSAQWAERAATLGSADGAFMMAEYFAAGYGVEKNWPFAYVYANVASARGNQEAGKLMADLEKKMTPGTIEKAQQLSHSLLKQFPAEVNSPATSGKW